MTPFAYRAVDPRGRIVRGRLDAGNLAELELRLARLDLELLHGKPAPRRHAPWQRQLPRRELINFCFHLEQFLQAGVPIIESLADLRDTIEHPHFREIVTSLVGAIEGGETLSQALERHPQVFDNVFCSLIRAGERAGELPTVLRAISTPSSATTNSPPSPAASPSTRPSSPSSSSPPSASR
jgi:type IV pilus assembly protein PilC